MRPLSRRDLRLGLAFDQILGNAREEKRQLLLGNAAGKRIAEIILMRMILAFRLR